MPGKSSKSKAKSRSSTEGDDFEPEGSDDFVPIDSTNSDVRRPFARRMLSMAIDLACCKRPPEAKGSPAKATRSLGSILECEEEDPLIEEQPEPEKVVRVFIRLRQADLEPPATEQESFVGSGLGLVGNALRSTFARIHWNDGENGSWREVSRTPTDWMSGEKPIWDHTCPAQLFRLSGGSSSSKGDDRIKIEVLEEGFAGMSEPSLRGDLTVAVSDLVNEDSVQSSMGVWGPETVLNLKKGKWDVGTVVVCVCAILQKQQTSVNSVDSDTSDVGDAIRRIQSLTHEERDRMVEDHHAGRGSPPSSESEAEGHVHGERHEERERARSSKKALGELGERLNVVHDERSKGGGKRNLSIGQASTRGSSNESNTEASLSVSANRYKELCDSITVVAELYPRTGSFSQRSSNRVVHDTFFRVMAEDVRPQKNLEELYQLSWDSQKQLEDAKTCKNLKLAQWLSEGSWRKGDPPEGVILFASVRTVSVQGDGLTVSVEFTAEVRRVHSQDHDTDTDSWWVRFSSPERAEAWREALCELVDIVRRTRH